MAQKTPLMQQYENIKKEYTDSILLFRMGDFYETFYSDAKTVSKILGITLTARHYTSETIPMAGFPIKSADIYINRLVQSSRKIAICEQLEEPKKGMKLVKRGVTEVITPGTLMRQSLLNEKENNYIASFMSDKNHYAALSDITTGEFRLIRFDTKDKMYDFMRKTKISEIITAEEYVFEDIAHFNLIPQYNYNLTENENTLKKHFSVNKLHGLGIDDNEAVIAAGVLINYINENQKTASAQIRVIKTENDSAFMYVDEQTLRNLEIFTRINGQYEYSFLHVIDRTCTPMGARALRNHLLHPYIEPSDIDRRLNETEYLIASRETMRKLTDHISSIGDIERIGIRILTMKASYRDVILLKNALMRIPDINALLSKAGIDKSFYDIQEMNEIIKLIDMSLDEHRILKGKKERNIKSGYNSEYDKLVDMSGNALGHIRQMESEEKNATGINTLKIGFNNIAGYFIEVTHSNKSKVPPQYIWKQSLKNSTRYTTAELKEYEDAVLHSDEKISELEKIIFNDILKEISNYYDVLKSNAQCIASLDMSVSFAVLAHEQSYTRPQFSDIRILIENGRHPVVEAVEGIGRFVPNSLIMDEKTQIILLTGPNMSGKSTYLRQNALILYMAHLGMYVPAERAVLPVTDRIFTRIGASDDISRGVSTFMAEMLESANIINNMTERSFIILDEIGRGTSTFDGLSIAWAIVEYLHECREKPNTLFATHYHELTELDIKLDRLKNYTTKIRKVKNRVLYLKKIIEGKSDESYGLEVAKMAGFPDSIIQSGYMILSMLKENEENIRSKIREIEQMQLFEIKNSISEVHSEIVQMLNNTDINDITPIESMLILKKLKDIADKER